VDGGARRRHLRDRRRIAARADARHRRLPARDHRSGRARLHLPSIVGVASFQLLSLIHGGGTIAPEWLLGLALGVGGLLGSYTGATLQPHVPERALRALLGVACVVIAVLYLTEGL
jgi:hypothetical protein